MRKKLRKFFIPGIYHNLEVRLGLRKTIAKLVKDKNALAFYEHRKCRIHLSEDLPEAVRLHTFFHELSHHIIDTLDETTDDEAKCNILGGYLMKLIEVHDLIETELNSKQEENEK